VEEGNPGFRLLDLAETLRAMLDARRGRTDGDLARQIGMNQGLAMAATLARA